MDISIKPKVVKIAIWTLFAMALSNIVVSVLNDSFVHRYISYLLENNESFRFRMDAGFAPYKFSIKCLGGFLPFIVIFLFSKKYNFARILSIMLEFLVSVFCVFVIYYDGFYFLNTSVLVLNLFILYLLFHKDTKAWIKS